MLERKSCKRVIQREKRKYLNEILQEAEKDRSQSNARNFFRTIKQYKSFSPNLKIIKSRNNDLIMDPKERAKRFEQYFIELLNADILVNPTRRKN